MYPNRPILTGPGERDAWFTAGNGPVRALIEINSPQLIRMIQAGLSNFITGVYAGSLPPGLVVPETARWDAATARATMLIADKTGLLKDAYDAAYIDSAWGEYYKRRWDLRLTTLALAVFSNSAVIVGHIEDTLGLPRTTQAGNPVDGPPPGFNAELPHDAILPRWDYAPRANMAEPSEVIRRICNGSLDNCV